MADESAGAPPVPEPAREALRQSEERFRLLVQSVHEYAIFMLDPDGRVSSWNAGAERMKGYSAADIIGQHFSVFYPPDALAANKPATELAIAMDRGVVEDEGWRLRKDGSRFWANVVITALRDAGGVHIGFAKVTRDLTERRRQEEAERQLAQTRLAESEHRFATFAQRLPGLAWIKDIAGRYTYVNDAAAAAFGGAPETILGRRDADLFPPDIVATFVSNDQRALQERTGIICTEQLTDARGTIRHSIVSKFPIADVSGSNALVGGIAIDITDRVQAEAALRDADRRKNEFLATLSHELRNPLAPIRNAVHMLRTETAGVSRERLYEVLNKQLDHLVRLVDDLLEISRITSGKVALQTKPIDLRDVLQSAVDATATLFETRRHHLAWRGGDAAVTVLGDPVRLTQVVVNLLNNAAKYTPDGGNVHLTLTRDGDEAVIGVGDDGVGIPTDMLARVFDMFAQVDRTLSRAQGGLGIGLALARSLVEIHGGRIEAQSRGLGLGSKFEVRIAAMDAPFVLASPVSDADAHAHGFRVLVVDDSRDGCDTLTMVLATLGIEARAVYDGESALATAREWSPDVVLLDIGMPGMDGYEVARRMRAEAGREATRLIALTGWGTADDRERSYDSGFDDHWVKPVDPAKLRGLLAPRLRRSESRK